MKDELQSKMVEILTAIQSTTGKASDFAMEQLPEIAQTYVMYGRVWGLVDAAVGLAIVALAVFACVRLTRAARTTDCDTFPLVLGALSSGTFGLLLLSFVMKGLQSTALVWFAPKVWLLKELASLVK